MTTSQAETALPPSFVNLKMDERKRSLAADVEDLAPSRKRLVKDDTGQQMRMDADREKDVEMFQKDAILRQMKEFKRGQKHWEDLARSLEEKSKDHDDHLRIIDAWFSQLLDALRVLATENLPTPPPSANSVTVEEMYKTALLFEGSEMFSKHLSERSQAIRAACADLFSRLPQASPDVQALQKQMFEALAGEKVSMVESQRLLMDNATLHERLEKASYRYMTAEKKLDRAKSQQVQKLERQAIMGGAVEASSPTSGKKSAVKSEHADVNGELENGMTTAQAEAARQEAIAVGEQYKAQMEELESENNRLTNDLSAARTRLVTLTDDDYAETSLFKTFRSQYEDLIKRINDLAMTNTQLREETQKYQMERTTYRSQLDEESRNQIVESESQLAKAETDLARIRNSRDELIAQLSIKSGAEVDKKASAAHAAELMEAQNLRLVALQTENERLKNELGERTAADRAGLDDLNAEELKQRLRSLQSSYDMLNAETSSMEIAWQKTQALATKKNAEFAQWEEQVARLNAEKAKADQKYFAAMKAKDSRDGELRVLKSQNARSSEIVSQMKDAESKTREYVVSLDRQIAEYKEGIVKLEMTNRAIDQKYKESGLRLEGATKQSEELKAMIKSKDAERVGSEKAKREAEVALAQCLSRLEDTKKQYDTLRKTRAKIGSASNDDWRKVAICPVCNANIRNTVLKLCGHVFCGSCVKDLIANRSRKCPSCGKNFGTNDQMGIVLT